MSIARITILAGGALCALLAMPRSAPAQQAPEPVLVEDLTPTDTPIVRRMLQDEAGHRDRMARIDRLRELALRSNQRERLMQLERLESIERERQAARRLMSRSQMSEQAFRRSETLAQRGGVIRMRNPSSLRAEQQRMADASAQRRRLQNGARVQPTNRKATSTGRRNVKMGTRGSPSIGKRGGSKPR
jgi:hypothetical protein